MSPLDAALLVWFSAANLTAFALFGLDKWRAGGTKQRVAEMHLVLAGALGGWLGGLAGMWLFRHKTSKRSFQFKYAAAFLIWAALVYAALAWRRG